MGATLGRTGMLSGIASSAKGLLAAAAFVLLICLFLTVSGGEGHAQEDTRIRVQPQINQKAVGSTVEITNRIPTIRPEFPVPDEPGMLFYLQRSTNPNTIIYAANFDEDGALNRRRPVSVYWRRFNTTGERKPLKMLENTFAFGVRAQPTRDPDVFNLHLVSLPDRKATVRQTGPGEAELVLEAGGYEMRPVYAYVHVDEDGFIPSVREVVLLGHERTTGKALVERIQIE